MILVVFVLTVALLAAVAFLIIFLIMYLIHGSVDAVFEKMAAWFGVTGGVATWFGGGDSSASTPSSMGGGTSNANGGGAPNTSPQSSGDRDSSAGFCTLSDCSTVVGTSPRQYIRTYSPALRNPTTCLCSPASCDGGWECTRTLQGGQQHTYAVKEIDYETGICQACPPICGGEEYCKVTATDGTVMTLQDASGNDILKGSNCECPPACPNSGSMNCPSGERRIYQPGTTHHCRCPAEQRLADDNMAHACATGGPQGGNFTNIDIVNASGNAHRLSWTSWYDCLPQNNDFAPGRYPADTDSDCQCKSEDLQNAIQETAGSDPNAYYNVCQWNGIEADGCGRARVGVIQNYNCNGPWGSSNCRLKGDGTNLRSHVESGIGSAWSPPAPPPGASSSPSTSSHTHPCRQLGNKTNFQLKSNINWNDIRWRGSGCTPKKNDFAPGYYVEGTGSNEAYCNPFQLSQAVEQARNTNNDNQMIGVCGSENDVGELSAAELRNYNCTDEWGAPACRTKRVGNETVNLRRHVYAGTTEPEAQGSRWTQP